MRVDQVILKSISSLNNTTKKNAFKNYGILWCLTQVGHIECIIL